MTETDWLTSVDPRPLLHALHGKGNPRKMRLLACACCRRVWDRIVDPASRAAVEASEQFADRRMDEWGLMRCGERLRPADTLAHDAAWAAWRGWAVVAAWRAAEAVESSCAEPLKAAAWLQERQGQADLVREVFGNPFRGCELPAEWLAWHRGTVRELAGHVYSRRAFHLMPWLGDALLDAGCTDEAVLDHCRQGGSHVAGCWVLDLILGMG